MELLTWAGNQAVWIQVLIALVLFFIGLPLAFILVVTVASEVRKIVEPKLPAAFGLIACTAYVWLLVMYPIAALVVSCVALALAVSFVVATVGPYRCGELVGRWLRRAK